jgi:hypothetical protein
MFDSPHPASIEFCSLFLTATDSDNNEEPKDTNPSNSNASNEWFPYKSKLLFLLNAVDNLPHLQISGSLMRVLLWLLYEFGVKKVPSFNALCKSQQNLCKEGCVPTIPCMSPKGNAFLFNDPHVIIANVSFNHQT